MGNEVTMMAGLQDKVKERIQSAFMDLVPAEMWEAMVSKELDSFTRNALPGLVREAAREHLLAMLKAELAKPEWQDRWTQSGTGFTTVTSEGITKALKDAAPELTAALFAGVSQQLVQALRGGLIRPL